MSRPRAATSVQTRSCASRDLNLPSAAKRRGWPSLEWRHKAFTPKATSRACSSWHLLHVCTKIMHDSTRRPSLAPAALDSPFFATRAVVSDDDCTPRAFRSPTKYDIFTRFGMKRYSCAKPAGTAATFDKSTRSTTVENSSRTAAHAARAGDSVAEKKRVRRALPVRGRGGGSTDRISAKSSAIEASKSRSASSRTKVSTRRNTCRRSSE
mmetsp:Transcript_6539/g.21086  ORF Transcript_6539/g.21086 Transcript_6539/m.21086 type:complete len:210 (+) Transcript_6539:323-952(+)